ncbi:prepilin-type N-terminal cleavage/methylation domain-containing protein [Candidatus Regiella endosymbiont of Tuberolachnus salignus]
MMRYARSYSFTLLEMLLVIAIFSMINIATYQILRTIFKNKKVF